MHESQQCRLFGACSASLFIARGHALKTRSISFASLKCSRSKHLNVYNVNDVNCKRIIEVRRYEYRTSVLVIRFKRIKRLLLLSHNSLHNLISLCINAHFKTRLRAVYRVAVSFKGEKRVDSHRRGIRRNDDVAEL